LLSASIVCITVGYPTQDETANPIPGYPTTYYDANGEAKAAPYDSTGLAVDNDNVIPKDATEKDPTNESLDKKPIRYYGA